MRNKEYDLAVKKINEHDLKCEATTRGNYKRTHKLPCRGGDPKVSFDHFYASHAIINRLLKDAPSVDYKDYFKHFEQIDFKNTHIQEQIQAQLCIDDSFAQKSLEQHCNELSLDKESSQAEVQIAYLKREIRYMVERLTKPSYRDLTHQQVATMHHYARFILHWLNNSNQPVIKLLRWIITPAKNSY